MRIVSYDKGKKRLSLSMKQWTEADKKDENDVSSTPNPPRHIAPHPETCALNRAPKLTH